MLWRVAYSHVTCDRWRPDGIERYLLRARIVRFRVQAHVTVILAMDEPRAGGRVVVDHAPDSERVHVTEAAGARLARPVGRRLLLVVVPRQVVLEPVPDERHAVVLGLGGRRVRSRHVHHLSVRWPERVRPQRLFVQRLFRGHRTAGRSAPVRVVNVIAVVSVHGGRDRIHVHGSHGIVAAVGRRGRR